jgi:hypothetical protein
VTEQGLILARNLRHVVSHAIRIPLAH